MVALALVNLMLLAFNATYLWLRPTYLDVAPGLVQVYDRVKGIRPHPGSEQLARQIVQVRAYLRSLGDTPADPERLAAEVSELRRLTLRVLHATALRYTASEHMGAVLRATVAKAVGMNPAEMDYPPNQRAAVEKLWPLNQRKVRARLEATEGPLLDALRANYYRSVTLDGALVDHFLLLELPFLVLFWLDFWAGWAIAMRQPGPRRWYRYPLEHWYDLLGLLPGEMRALRLFRLVALYTRIYRGEMRQVRDNLLKRFTTRTANVVSEEVTNRVQVRVVDRLKTELEHGTVQASLRAALSRHRTALVESTVDQLQHVMSDVAVRQRVLELVALTTDQAFPRIRARPLARELTTRTIERSVAATLAALARAMQSEHGREATRCLVTTALDSSESSQSTDELLSVVSAVAFEVAQDLGVAAQRRLLSIGAHEGTLAESPQDLSSSSPERSQGPTERLTVCAERAACDPDQRKER